MSQDFVFLNVAVDGRKGQALEDPQLQNAYSYAKNNPLKLVDKDGEFAQALIGAGAAIIGQYGFDVFHNIQADGLSLGAFYTNLSSPETYAVRALQGASIALTGGAAAAAGIGTLGQVGIAGTASGVSGVLGNAYLGAPITAQSIAADIIIGSTTFGALKSVPAVPGRLPNFGSSAFVGGKHTQQSAMQLGVESMAAYLSTLLGDASLGGNAQTYTTPSGAVVDSSGDLLSGPNLE